MKIKACPVCGRALQHHCFHNKREIPTLWISADEARTLLDKWIKAHELELFDLKAHRNRYHNNPIWLARNQPK